MFSNDLWGFSIDSSYFGYNFAEQENLVLCSNLSELKLTWDFSDINILSRESFEAQEFNQVGHKGQMSTGGVGLGQAAPPILVWASRLRCRLSLSHDPQLDLKTTI
jgi:hypothetical protein